METAYADCGYRDTTGAPLPCALEDGPMMWLAGTMLLAALSAGCATVQPSPPTGTFWGYTSTDSTGRAELLATPDKPSCEKARATHVMVAKMVAVPFVCRRLVISSGADFWVVPAIYLPAASWLGANSREECAEIDKRQSRDSAVSTRQCQPVGVRLMP